MFIFRKFSKGHETVILISRKKEIKKDYYEENYSETLETSWFVSERSKLISYLFRYTLNIAQSDFVKFFLDMVFRHHSQDVNRRKN